MRPGVSKMAFVFRDKMTKQILRIDFGKPDPEKYGAKEGLQNWEVEEMADEEAKKLVAPNSGVKNSWPDRWKSAKTDAEKLSVLAQYLGWE